MAASTTLADGTVLRWHDDLTECARSACPEYHVTKAELLDVDPTDALAIGFDLGKAAGKGEL